jgi:hypothetical protein
MPRLAAAGMLVAAAGPPAALADAAIVTRYESSPGHRGADGGGA